MPTKMDQYLEIICIKANRDLRRKYYNVIEQVLFLPPDRPVQCAIRWLLLGVMMGSSSVHVLLAVGNGSIWFSRHDGLLKSFCSLSVNFLWTCMMIIASSWKDDSALDLWSHSSSMFLFPAHRCGGHAINLKLLHQNCTVEQITCIPSIPDIAAAKDNYVNFIADFVQLW